MLYETPNPHGGDLYSREILLDFSANINPYGTPRAVKEAVAASVENLRCYPDPYCRKLISAIADFEQVPANFRPSDKKPCQALFSVLYLFESFFTIFHQLFLPQSTAFLPVFWELWTNCDYIVNYVKNCCAFLWTLSLDFRIKVGDNVAVVVGTYVPIQNILYVSRRSPND